MKILLIFVFVFISISCDKKKDIENSKNEVDTLTLKSFDYKYKNEPKYFLKFWDKMTKEEFNNAKNLMKKEGIIDLSYNKYGTFYDIKIGDDLINLTPVFEKNVIIGIKIPDVSENVYSLFAKKYNLPKLVKESTIGLCYKESNPCFLKEQCNDFLNISNDIREVPLNEVKKFTNLNEDLENYYIKILPQDDIELENKNSNILLTNSSTLGGISLIGKLKDIKHDLYYSKFYYPNDGGLFESLNYSKNRKTEIRYIVTKNKYTIDITYYPNDYFAKQSKLQKKEKLKEQKLKIETIKKQEKFIDQI